MTGDAPTSAKPKRRPIRVLLYILVGLLVLILLALTIFNFYIRMSYANFYEQSASEFETPGISEGFIPQDIAHVDEDDSWIFSGYMDNGSASPIYRRAADGTTSKIFVYLPGGTQEYTGHGGGVAVGTDWVYLTYESNYLAIPLEDVIGAKDGTFVTASSAIPVEFTPAFINILNGNLYLGNFYHSGKYESPDKMHLATPDGSVNQAVMYEFAPDESEPYGFSTVPQCVYSIPDRVQGVCIADGKVVFSTSWGISASHLLVYSEPKDTAETYPYSTVSIAVSGEGNADDGILIANDVEDANEATARELATGTDIVDVPLKYFCADNQIEDIDAPPMTEGISLYDGRVYIANESASNKYIFGKLYGGSTIYSVRI